MSESVAFVPDLENAPKFGDLCADESLSAESIKAGEMLDKERGRCQNWEKCNNKLEFSGNLT